MGGSAPVPARIEGRMMDILIIIQQAPIMPQIQSVQLTPQPVIHLRAHLNKNSLKLVHIKDNIYSIYFQYDTTQNSQAILSFNAQQTVIKGNQTIILSGQSTIRSLIKGLSQKSKQIEQYQIPVQKSQNCVRGLKIYDLVVEVFGKYNQDYKEFTYVEFVKLEGKYEANVLFQKIAGNKNSWLIDTLYQNEERCVVCMDEKPPSVALSPCMHQCLCEQCGEGIKERRVCPVCRTPIKKILKIQDY